MNPLFSKTLALAMGISLSSVAFAQTSTTGISGQANLQALASLNAGAQARGFDNRYEGVKGNPYFLNSFLSGKIIVKAGNTGKTEAIENIKLKYDVFSNLLVAYVPQTKDTLHISTVPVSSFSLEIPSTGNLMEFKRHKEAKALDPNLSDAFFGTIYESEGGKVSFLKRVVKKKIDANYKGAYSAGVNYDEIYDEVHYYVLANGALQKVKLNRKAILEALPMQADKLKSFISANKLAMGTEEDVVKVLTYSQTL